MFYCTCDKIIVLDEVEERRRSVDRQPTSGKKEKKRRDILRIQNAASLLHFFSCFEKLPNTPSTPPPSLRQLFPHASSHSWAGRLRKKEEKGCKKRRKSREKKRPLSLSFARKEEETSSSKFSSRAVFCLFWGRGLDYTIF